MFRKKIVHNTLEFVPPQSPKWFIFVVFSTRKWRRAAVSRSGFLYADYQKTVFAFGFYGIGVGMFRQGKGPLESGCSELKRTHTPASSCYFWFLGQNVYYSIADLESNMSACHAGNGDFYFVARFIFEHIGQGRIILLIANKILNCSPKKMIKRPAEKMVLHLDFWFERFRLVFLPGSNSGLDRTVSLYGFREKSVGEAEIVTGNQGWIRKNGK